MSVNSDCPVVFATDERYIEAVRIAVTSVIHSSSPGQRFVILHSGVAAGLQFHTSVKNTRIDWRFSSVPEGLRVDEWISSAVYLRLTIPDVLREYEECVYLDADLIALHDIEELKQHTSDLAVSAVQDLQNPTLERGEALPGWATLGLAGTQPYFNSGVMKLNLSACRDVALAEACWGFLVDYSKHARYWDQDALNFVCRGGWDQLPTRWNVPPMSAILRTPGPHDFDENYFHLQELLRLESRASILHYTGPVKPWAHEFPQGKALDLYRRIQDLASRINWTLR